jgi:hypothetical protein
MNIDFGLGTLDNGEKVRFGQGKVTASQGARGAGLTAMGAEPFFIVSPSDPSHGVGLVRFRSARSAVILACVALLPGCRVEETPPEFIDHQDSIEEERAEAGAEVRDRLLAFGGGVARGDATEALLALNPASDVEIVGPDSGLDVDGRAAAGALIQRLAGTPVALRIREVEVRTGSSANVAWFRLLIEAPGSTPEASLYRATGIYLRDAGLWELAQAHISGPLIPQVPPNQPASVDDAEGGG